MASNSEWELVDKEEEEGDRPILGVFIPSVGFLPFRKQGDSSDSAVVPTSTVTVVSSSAGLVLSRGPWSTYHVVDTLSSGSHHHHLPRPTLPHPPVDVPSAVLRVGPTPAGLFAVVCAIGGGGGDATADGVYAFDAFDSLSGRWTLSSDRFPVGRIDPDSGVAAAGSAYWRTCPPTPMVVGYDPSSGRVRILPPPPGAWAASKDRWQLGSTRGGGLCSVVLTDTNKAVGYKMEASADRWGLVGSVQLAGLASAEPVRFEWSGTAMEVVLLLEGKLVVVDLEKGKVVSIKSVPTPAPTIAAKKMVTCIGKPKISDEEYVKVDDAAAA